MTPLNQEDVRRFEEWISRALATPHVSASKPVHVTWDDDVFTVRDADETPILIGSRPIWEILQQMYRTEA